MINILKNCILDTLKIRRKPKVLQMPITSRCNSRCKTCNVWKLTSKTDINPLDLSSVLQDDFFSEVEAVGINGGEPTLVKNLDEIVEVILGLKKIKYLHFISNGLLSEKLLNILEGIKIKCQEKGVALGFTLSIDGVGEIYESVRGVPNSFKKIEFLLEKFHENLSLYCDTFNIGCTISKYNIPYIKEIDLFLSNYHFPVDYHLAVPNKRIYTFEDSSYYILTDERSRLLAAEFFYGKYTVAPSYLDKFKYFSSYYFLKHNGHKRLMSCSYRYRDVTIDENLNLSLCATASDIMGNLKEESATSMLKGKKIKQMAHVINKYCDTCIHYKNTPTIRGGMFFLYEHAKRRLDWFHKFKFLIKW